MGDSVLVVNAGGTIGMVGTPHGYAPVPGGLGPYLEWIVENSRGELAPITFLELDPPIDSANATPDSWRQIASILFQQRSDHAGFVVLHGTDTMAYTSSALSFLLPSFGKPVVVTGSHRHKGVGRKLLRHVAAEAKKRNMVSLTISPSSRNVDAIRSLHAAGYDVVSSIELTMDLDRHAHEWQQDGLELHELQFRS